MGLLVIAPCRHRHRSQTDHHINLNYSAVDNDKNDNRQYAHRNANKKALQEKAEQRADVEVHHAAFQHGKANVVDPRVAADNATGICHDLLGHIKHSHDDVKRVADEPDRNGGLEYPLHQQSRLELCHVVVLGDELYQLIASDESEDDARNRKDDIAGQRLYHGEDARLETGRLSADLLGDATHLRVDIIEQAAEIGHDGRSQQRFYPIAYGFENGFHSEPPPIRKNG